MRYKPAHGLDCGQEQCNSIAATTSLCEQAADRWVCGRGRWENLLLCCARWEYVHGGRAVGGRAVPKVRSLALGTAARQRAVGPGPHLQGVHVLLISLLSSTSCRARSVDAMQLHCGRLALFAAGETAKALAIGMALFCWRAAHDGWQGAPLRPMAHRRCLWSG